MAKKKSYSFFSFFFSETLFSKKRSSHLQSPKKYEDISDRPTSNDLLQYEKLVQPLCEKIASATRENTPFSVGIFGKWGSGKTSFLMMMDKNLSKRGIIPIWFHAWKYDREDNLWSALIQKILNDATIRQPPYRAVWIKLQIWLGNVRLMQGFGEILRKVVEHLLRLLIVVLCVYLFVRTDPSTLEGILARLFGNNLTANKVFYEVFVKSALAVLAIWASNPREILNLMNRRLGIDLSKFSAQKTYKDHIAFIDNFTNELQTIIDKIASHGPVVVFIDDLDRCLPEKAVQVLEAMKLLLEIRNCVFVLAVDQSVIEKAIFLRYKDLIEISNELDDKSIDIVSFGKNYFEKLVQLPVNLPHLAYQDIEAMVLKLYPRENATEFARVLSIGIESNPRKIKRAVESFLFLRQLASKLDAEKKVKTSLLAKIVVIQNRYPTLYDDITEIPELLKRLEEYSRTERIHQGDYLSTIDDALVRAKVSLYITRHPPLQSILRQATDENDTFLQADIQSYTHLLSPLSDFKHDPFDANSLLIREYLRRMIDEEPFIRQEYIVPNFSEFSSRVTKNQNLELLEVEQLLKQNTRVVILGSSGIGKTYLIKYLQATYATAIIEQDPANATSTSVLRPHFPISLKPSLLAELDLIKKSPLFILELVKQNFQRLGIQSIDQVMTSVIRFFEKGQCLLMIDALDEMPDEKRLLFEEIFNEFSAMYPGNIYLITMRTPTFSIKNRLAAFKPFVLHPWTSEQINSFVTHKIPDLPLEHFNSYLTRNPNLKSLTKFPLFLSILVKAYSKYHEFPPHVGVSVGTYIESLLMDSTSSIVGISPDKLKDFFINVAVTMEEKHLSTLDKSEVIAVLEKITGESTSYAMIILEKIATHSGFYLEDGYGKFSFLNILISEYFSSLYLKGN